MVGLLGFLAGISGSEGLGNISKVSNRNHKLETSFRDDNHTKISYNDNLETPSPQERLIALEIIT